MPSLPLLDKRITLTFTRDDGTTVVLPTPPTGRKPSIRLNGTFVAQLVVMHVDIRIWNFTSDLPLSSYKKVKVTAGYADDFHATISGVIMNSFRETPGPDGITVFQMLVGLGEDWVTTTINRTFPAGQTLDGVLRDVCSVLGLTLKNYADPTLALKVPIAWNGTAKNLLDKLSDLFKDYDADSGAFIGLRMVPFGDDLIVYRGDQGTGVVHELKYIAHAMHVGRGVDVQGPWIPTIRPGDTVKVDPKYFRQDISGAASGTPGSLFNVFMLEFAFATDTDENMMTLLTVGASEAA